MIRFREPVTRGGKDGDKQLINNVMKTYRVDPKGLRLSGGGGGNSGGKGTLGYGGEGGGGERGGN